MKTMRMSAILVAMLITLFGCQKLEYVEFEDLNPANDGVLKISVSGGPTNGLKSSATTGDTITIEGGNQYLFSYTSTVAINTVQWSFSNNGNTSNEHMPSNMYTRNFVISSVTLVAIDVNGTSHTSTIWLNNLPRVAGDPIIWKGKTLISSGIYKQEFWVYKNGAYMSPVDYRMKGNITNPPWSVLPIIPPADTNYRLENGNLYAMTGGENGHWTKVFIESSINFDVEVAPLIRLVSGIGEQWASFKGSQFVHSNNYGLMIFHVDASGNVSTTGGGNNNAMPGLGGDAIIRFDVSSTNITIYQYNGSAFTTISPWIQFKVNDSWSTPMYASTVVTGYPNWSKYVIAKSDLPKSLRFGSYINNGNVNANNVNSIFYDDIYKHIYVTLANVQ